jgi:hypothetical protein
MKVIESNYPTSSVSKPYIGSLYILAGCTKLFQLLSGSMPYLFVIIAFGALSLITSLAGLIMSCMSKAKGTCNKSRLIGIFACMFAETMFALIALYFAGIAARSGAKADGHLVVGFLIIAMIPSSVSSCLIITLSTREERVQLSKTAKLIVGIVGILSVLTDIVVLFFVRLDRVAVYAHIAFAGLLFGGIIIGMLQGTRQNNDTPIA